MMATATMMSSFFKTSSSSIPFRRTPFLYSPSPVPSFSHVKKGVWGQGYVLFQVNCASDGSEQTAESETGTSLNSSLESFSSSAITEDVDDAGIASYKWCAGLGGIGFLDTAYLTYLKLTNSDALCPMGGGSCTSILNSDYSFVFATFISYLLIGYLYWKFVFCRQVSDGIPLPLFGMLAYGLVTSLGLQLSAKKRTFDTDKTDGEIILIGTTTSMAVASAYFLYILRTEFSGELCLYCLASAILSFSLFFITLKRFGLQELQKILSLQLVIASSVVIALTASYNNIESVSSSMTETEIPYFQTEITKESSPMAISLAKYLRLIGAKLYGAFWCSHCQDQKEIFGREAAKMLDYVECFPDGVSKGAKMAQVCTDVKLEGFPTWIINGQVLSGEKQLSELATLAGIKLEDTSQSN